LDNADQSDLAGAPNVGHRYRDRGLHVDPDMSVVVVDHIELCCNAARSAAGRQATPIGAPANRQCSSILLIAGSKANGEAPPRCQRPSRPATSTVSQAYIADVVAK
jgi:hypothetical protein